MKNSYLQIIAIFFLIATFFPGCKPESGPEDTLALSVASISASADANSYDVKVTTTATQFTAISDVDWCVVSIDLTKLNFTLAVTKNTLTIPRKAKITVTIGSKTALVSINQAGGVYVQPVYTPTNRDSLALLALNTGTSKWNTAQPFAAWAGVKVEVIAGYRRVTELNIPAANISTGVLTDSIKNLTELVYLDVSGNNLSGAIPVLSGLNKLVVLDMKNNKLTGSIPALPVSLAYVSLGQNNLSGTLPVQIKDLSVLMILDLGLNDLTGAIPAQWSSLIKIKYFYLYGNQLSGTIPAFISSYTKMEALALDFNQLTGSILTGIGAIASLKKLTLQQNKLTGAVPSDLLSNPNWTSWRATVEPQQDGVSLSGAPAGISPLKIQLENSQIKRQVYSLPDKNLFIR